MTAARLPARPALAAALALLLAAGPAGGAFPVFDAAAFVQKLKDHVQFIALVTQTTAIATSVANQLQTVRDKINGTIGRFADPLRTVADMVGDVRGAAEETLAIGTGFAGLPRQALDELEAVRTGPAADLTADWNRIRGIAGTAESDLLAAARGHTGLYTPLAVRALERRAARLAEESARRTARGAAAAGTARAAAASAKSAREKAQENADSAEHGETALDMLSVANQSNLARAISALLDAQAAREAQAALDARTREEAVQEARRRGAEAGARRIRNGLAARAHFSQAGYGRQLDATLAALRSWVPAYTDGGRRAGAPPGMTPVPDTPAGRALGCGPPGSRPGC